MSQKLKFNAFQAYAQAWFNLSPLTFSLKLFCFQNRLHSNTESIKGKSWLNKAKCMHDKHVLFYNSISNLFRINLYGFSIPSLAHFDSFWKRQKRHRSKYTSVNITVKIVFRKTESHLLLCYSLFKRWNGQNWFITFDNQRDTNTRSVASFQHHRSHFKWLISYFSCSCI